jgi:hypothetical protein
VILKCPCSNPLTKLARKAGRRERGFLKDRLCTRNPLPVCKLRKIIPITLAGTWRNCWRGLEEGNKSQVIDAEIVKPKALPAIRDNSYCATDSVQPIVTTTPKVLGKVRHRRMRTRKPRAESLAKYALPPRPLPRPQPPCNTYNPPQIIVAQNKKRS